MTVYASRCYSNVTSPVSAISVVTDGVLWILSSVIFQHTQNIQSATIKAKPAAYCCCPDIARDASVSQTASFQSSQSAGQLVVKEVTLTAGTRVPTLLSWHKDIWSHSVTGSDSDCLFPDKKKGVENLKNWKGMYQCKVFYCIGRQCRCHLQK